MKMGIEACPLCNTVGPLDSTALINHVLEHVHDFSLRSLPWPNSAAVALGGEVGSYDESGDADHAVKHWLAETQTEGDGLRPSLQMSIYDHDRLSIVKQLIESEPQDILGIGIYFAHEEGAESAEAEDGETVSGTSRSLAEDDITMGQSRQNDEESRGGDPAFGPRRSRRRRLFERATKAFIDIRTSREAVSTTTVPSGPKVETVAQPSNESVALAASALFGSSYVLPPWNQTTLDVLYTLFIEILRLSIRRGQTRPQDDYLTISTLLRFTDSVQSETVKRFVQPLHDLDHIKADTFVALMLRFCVEGLQPIKMDDTSGVISDYFINTSHGPPMPIDGRQSNLSSIIQEYREVRRGMDSTVQKANPIFSCL